MCASKLWGGTGFKNLELFNLALLAKQGWQMIQNPNSLLSQDYKAKYFSTTNFLYSYLGRKFSYVWRSICASKPLLISRGIWKIGKGDSVRINQDKSVPNFWLPQSLLPNHVLQDNSKVNMFMYQHNGAWDVGLIQSIFSIFIANAII